MCKRERVYWVLGILISATVVFLIMKQVDSDAVVGFLGVLIGAGVSSATSFLLANRSYRQQLAMAALDRRLAVHQQAYIKWMEIIESYRDKEKVYKVVKNANAWWRQNCLYLDAQSRIAFKKCIGAAELYPELNVGPDDPEKRKKIKECNETIWETGRIIVQGVALPNLEDETGLKEKERKNDGNS
ncbi:hypothetical protein LLH00_04790 [bacterium]|nr:hypothetical protein [bacterium]